MKWKTSGNFIWFSVFSPSYPSLWRYLKQSLTMAEHRFHLASSVSVASRGTAGHCLSWLSEMESESVLNCFLWWQQHLLGQLKRFIGILDWTLKCFYYRPPTGLHWFSRAGVWFIPLSLFLTHHRPSNVQNKAFNAIFQIPPLYILTF